MINQFIKSRSGLRRLEEGPLGSYAETYARHLGEFGYRPATMRHNVLLLVALNEWLKKKKLKLRQLDSSQIDHFLEERRRKRSSFRGSIVAINRLAGLLRQEGVIPIAPPEKSDRSEIEEEYSEYLLKERAHRFSGTSGKGSADGGPRSKPKARGYSIIFSLCGL